MSIRLLQLGLVCSTLFAFSLIADKPTADLVVVEKAKRTLLIMRNGAVLKTYRVALGASPVGPKKARGDHKTPEGEYVVDSRNAASQFHRGLHVSYPNAADRARAKRDGVDPGDAIMIHGLPNGSGWIGAGHRAVDWTDGCIAVTDSEIEEIWALVPNGTRIVIKP